MAQKESQTPSGASVDMESEIRRLKEENELLKMIILKKEGIVPGRMLSSDQKNDLDGIFSGNQVNEKFFNEIPLMMWAKNKKGIYTRCNSTFARILGRKAEDIIGKSDQDLYPAVTAGIFESEDLMVMNTGKQSINEVLFPLRDGPRWYETIKLPLWTKNTDRIKGVAAFARDISERKGYEQALIDGEEKFRELAENTNDSFILIDGKKLIYANPAFESVYGISREELKKNPWVYRNYIHPDDKKRIDKVFSSSQYKSTFIFDEQYRILKKNNELSWIWQRSYPVWNDHGQTYRIVSVATDISEIKNLEEELRQSQSRQQAILDNIPHLAWLKDKEGRYVSVNQAFKDFYRKPSEELIGKTDLDLCPPRLAKDYMRKDRLVLKTGKAALFYEVEEGYKGKRYSETHKAPVFSEDGKVTGITGISRDITEQKLSEQALKRSEEKFKDIITLLPEVVFETDTEGNVTYVNLKGFEIMEFDQDDFEKGLNIFEVISPEDKERANESFWNLRYGNELQGKEYTVVSRSGKEIPVLVFTNNIYQDGIWAGIRGVMVDITNRKKAEEQEKAYQSKLVYLSDTALDFLSMSSEENIFAYIGLRLTEFIDDVEVVINQFQEKGNYMKMIYNSFNKTEIRIMKKYLGTNEEEFGFEIKPEMHNHLRKNADHLYEFTGGFSESTFGLIPEEVSDKIKKELGINRFFGMSLSKDKKLYGSVLILTRARRLQDKHFIEAFLYQATIALHRRQLETDLLTAKTKAEESDKLKTAFLANMSHEIRTPMNGILGLTDMLMKSDLDEKTRSDYLAMVNSNGKLLLGLVNDIIDISKIESSQIDLNESEFSLNSLMNELHCFILAEKMVKQKETLELKYSPGFEDDKSFIFSDKTKIRQVLINLIGNAIKFTQEGEVEFGYKQDNQGDLLFYVRDTGIGIPMEKLKLVFDRFTQADQSLTRPYGGSGLGLAISRGFVQAMGGEIWVESKEKQGSVFYFTIPYKPVKKYVAKAPEASASPADFHWENLKILIVEDNIISFKLLEISLKRTGCSILHAGNGQEAIDKVKEDKEIGLVLMDIQLPVMNGYDATVEIKKIRPELTVIAQTANALDEDRNRCLEAGCADYITKPIVLDKLLHLIQNNL